MFTFLPEDEKKNLEKEYLTRRGVVISFFVFVLCIISSVSLFPSYVLSLARVHEIESDLSSIEKSNIHKEAEELDATLKETNKKLEALKIPENIIYVEDIILSVVEKRSNSVRISGFSYTRSSEKNMGTFLVTGIARDRGSLSEFVKLLQENKDFKEVNLPVSNFAKERNSEFTVEIRGDF